MKHNDVDDPPVILYGRSLGGAVAMQCALEKPVRGLIIESAFASIPAMARELYPWLPIGLIGKYRYDNLAKVADLEVPLLVSASRGDTLVPYEQTRSIFEAAPQPKFWCELAGDHTETGWDRSPDYWKAIREFVDYALD
jgi:pimeloyl-ACP methyl ester carboxylesterase